MSIINTAILPRPSSSKENIEEKLIHCNLSLGKALGNETGTYRRQSNPHPKYNYLFSFSIFQFWPITPADEFIQSSTSPARCIVVKAGRHWSRQASRDQRVLFPPSEISISSSPFRCLVMKLQRRDKKSLDSIVEDRKKGPKKFSIFSCGKNESPGN